MLANIHRAAIDIQRTRPSDLAESAMNVPKEFGSFLQTLLTGNKEWWDEYCQFRCALKLKFVKTVCSIFLQSKYLQPAACQPSIAWRADCDSFTIDLMSPDPVLTVVLELLCFSCTRSYRLPTCSCMASGLKCTDVCKLLDCDSRCEDCRL